MYAGRFVETAPSDHIFLAPTHPYSEALLRCVPNPEKLVDGPLPAIPGFPPNLAQLPGGCAFAPRCPVGSEIQRCHAEAPEPLQVDGPEGPAVVECHFAHERIAEAARA
jgi:oligopeptide/dipeptide ABC transporter ATP-binding protein